MLIVDALQYFVCGTYNQQSFNLLLGSQYVFDIAYVADLICMN